MIKKGINTATMEFKNSLVNLINNSGLPVCIVSMTLSETLNSVNLLLHEELSKEKLQYEQEGVDGEKVYKD